MYRSVWFLPFALVTLTGLAFVAAHASTRIKLIGLFPIALGIAAGVLIASLGRRQRVSRRVMLTAAVVLIPPMFAGYAGESFRNWRSNKADEFRQYLNEELPGGRAILEQLNSDSPPASAVEKEFYAAYRSRLNPRATQFLTERLRGLPLDVEMPWAAVVAGMELLLGCIAGVATAVIASRSASPNSEDRT